jgi:hypothetical protein
MLGTILDAWGASVNQNRKKIQILLALVFWWKKTDNSKQQYK